MEESSQNLESPKPRHGAMPGSNNGGGRKTNKDILAEAIEKKIKRRITAEFWIELIDTVAEPLLHRLMEEDIPANVRLNTLELILNRGFGKVKEIHEHTGKDGSPLFLPLEIMEKNNLMKQDGNTDTSLPTN